jgi:PAS domain S-box-containing protein
MSNGHQSENANGPRITTGLVKTLNEQTEMASMWLAAIVESSDDAIISKDLNSIITSWNKGAERIFGYIAPEMVGTSIMRLIPADRQNEENLILGKIKNGESVKHFETRRQTKDGRLIDVSVCASPIKDGTGKVIGVSKVVRDITGRKQAESRIRYLNRVYAVLSDINQTIVREKDSQAMLATACRIAVEKGQFRMAWIGLADEALHHVKLTAHAGATADTLKILPGLLGDESHDCKCSLTLKALQTGTHATCNDIEHDPQTAVWRDDALQRGYRAMASLPLKVEGKVVGTFNIYADESDFFDAEELRLMDELAMDIGFALEVSRRDIARRASETRYRALFDYAPDGIVIADSESYYLDANASICRMLGYTHEELVGKHASDIVVPSQIKHIGKALEIIKTSSNYHHEWQFRRKDGSVFDAEVIATTMPDGNLLALIRDITERKRAETSLNLFRTLVDQSSDGIDVVDPKTGRFIDVNGTSCQRLGYRREELLSMTVPDIETAMGDFSSWQKSMEEIRQSGSKVVEGLQRRKDGSTFPVEVSIRYVRLDRDYLIASTRDITERKRAEEAIHRSREEFKDLFDNAPVGFHEIDAEGRIVRINNTELKMLGYSAEELLGQFVWKISADEELSRRVSLAKLSGEMSPSREGFERIFRRKDGSTFPVLINDQTLKREDGCVIGIRASVQDITERKKADESLRLLESAIKQSKESILITDAQLDLPGPKIIFVNPAFTQMTGYIAEEVIGKTPRILQGPRTDKAVLARLRKNLEQGEIFAGETVNYRKDGKEFDLEWQVAPLRDAGGKITHFVATQHDITERKKLEAQFLQSQKMEGIGQLAGGVAHDFNNILAVIQMQSDLLKADDGLSQTQFEMVSDIGAASQRAAALTRQLLVFSRKQTMNPCNLDLNKSINDMTKLLRRTLRENIELQFKFAMQPLFIHADAGMMDQVLLNLAVNARDAMPEGGQLVIETSAAEFDEAAALHSGQIRPGKFVCLSVSDTGCGIPRENLSKIFEPFFTTKDTGKGTGLGLATVFGIVQQHKGWVNVYSEVGRGTTFRIYLPRLEKMSEQKTEQPVLTAMRGGSETILLVEDDAFLRASVRKALTQLGYRVLEAVNGVEALDVWNQHSDEIDLLLTDLVMPGGISGIELSGQLLELEPKLKVIYASGYSAEVASKDFHLEEGVNFLTKPFQAQKLAQTIRNCLDKNEG